MKSSKLHLTPRRRTFVRLLGEIQHALNQALDEEHQKRGLTRAELARRIGRNKSFVTRKLNGTDNMTLQTFADLAYALDRPIKVSLPARHAAAAANHVPLIEETTPSSNSDALEAGAPPMPTTSVDECAFAMAA